MNSTKKSGKRKDLHDRMPSAVPKRNRVLDDEDDDWIPFHCDLPVFFLEENK